MQPTGNPDGRERQILGDAIDQFPLIAWTTDRDLRFTSSRGGGLGTLGLQPGEVVGRTLFEYFATEDPAFEPIAEHLRALEGHSGDYDFTWQGNTFRTHIGPLRDPSGGIVGTSAFAIDITDERNARNAALTRDRILSAVSSAARRLLGAPWEDVALDMLAALGTATDVSRAYVFENARVADEPLRMRQRFEWVAPEVHPFIDEALLRDLSFEEGGFGRWIDVLGSGGVIAANVSDLPASERAILRAQDIVSICAVPIDAGGRWWGFLGFDECRSERTWSAAEVGELQAAAALLGAAIGRQQAEDRTKNAEERYRTLVEQLPVVVYREAADEVGTAMYVSPQYERIFGYAPEVRLRDPGFWWNHLHPEDRERIQELVRWADETGEPFSAEYRYIASDGRAVWVRDEAVLLRDPQGEPLLWQGVLLNITRQKELEEANRESELRYRSVVENIGVITYIEGPGGQGDPRFISPQVEVILGYTPEEWIARQGAWMDLVHPEDREPLATVERDTQVTLEPFHAEYRVRAKDGRWVWLRDDALPIRGEDGELAFWQGIQQDITEQRQAEDALREAEARYRAIVEHIPAAIYVDAPDESMRSLYVSPQVEQITGFTVEQYLAEPELWLHHMREDHREEMRRSYLDAIGRGEPWMAEYPLRTPDGREVWIHDETTFVRDEHGQPLFLQGVLFDITERRLAERALAESERREREAADRLRALDEMKNSFLAAVSHELRSPLTSVLGLALTLEQQPDLAAAERSDLLSRLAANARKLDDLLRDLLDIDRLSRGIMTPKVRPTDVGEVTRRVVGNLDVPGTRSIVVQAEPVVVPVDPPKVERIVENLVVNAIRHTEPDVTIWVRTSAHEGGALIAVEDDGLGVPADLRQGIFEPFQQGPTATPYKPGTGIGLSLVAMFAELHGGRAWVQDRDGGGASFRVFLPGESQAAASESASWGEPGGNGASAPSPVERAASG